MTTYTLRSGNPARTRSDAVVVGVMSDQRGVRVAPGGEEVAASFGRKWGPLLANLGITGKVGDTAILPTAGVINAPMLVIVGLGSTVDEVALRKAAGHAARSLNNATSLAFALPATEPSQVRAIVEGFALGSYTFTKHKSKPPTKTAPGTVSVLSPIARQHAAQSAFEVAQQVAAATVLARDWTNEPASHLRPPGFAEAISAQHLALTKGRKAPTLTLEILDEAQLAELGCGGILGVGQGSSAPPRLVKLQWVPNNASKHLALVGKGITFDSGGLTIKPASGMNSMKTDMGGAAAVIAATFAIARLDLPIQVTTYAPLAENMISGAAMRPGDVLTMVDGTTVEVLNTDAEGRLILADALALATQDQPDLIVDVATLTGHMALALGDRVAALFSNRDDAQDAVQAAGARAGEQLWPMPITSEVEGRLKSSKVADLAQHDWVRWGGGLLAAAFLREFVKEIPWVHLDIAGPSWNSSGPDGHLTWGATGFGVATLIELAASLAEPDPTD